MLANGLFSQRVVKTYFSTSVEASKIVTTSPCFVLQAIMSNGNAATRFIQGFDSTTLPADGVVPYINFTVVGATTNPGYGALLYRYFSTGLVVCNSSTGATKTIGSADSLFAVWYTNVDT